MLRRLHRICSVVGLMATLTGLITGALFAQEQTNSSAPKTSSEVTALLDTAKKARNERKFAEALDNGQKALERSKTLADAPGEAASHLMIGKAYLGLREAQKAMDALAIALGQYRKIGDRAGEAEALSSTGMAYYNLGQPIKARDYFVQAQPIFHEVKDLNSEAGMLMNTGIVFENTGEPQKALSYYEKTLPVFRELKNIKGEANTLSNIAVAYGKLEQPKKSLEYHLKALPLYREAKDPVYELLAMRNICSAYLQLSQIESALDFAQQATKLAKSLNDPLADAQAMTLFANIYYTTGELQKAMEYYERVLPVVRASRDKRQENRILSNMSIIYSRQGDTRRALESMQQQYQTDLDLSDKAGQAAILNNIGFVYSDATQPQAARPYFEKALALGIQLKDRSIQAHSFGGLGNNADQIGQKERALIYYRDSLKIFRELNEKGNMANVLGNIAKVEMDLKRYALSREHQKEALALFRQVNDNSGVANATNALGELERLTGNLKQAHSYFKQSFAAAEKAGNRLYQSTALYNMGRVAWKQKHIGEAESCLRRSVSLLETLRANYGGLSETQSGFLADKLPTYRACMMVLLEQGKASEAFDLAQKTKARALLDLMASGHTGLSDGLTPEERAQERSLRQRTDYLNLQMVKEGVQNEIGAKKRFAALKEQLRQTEGELRTLWEQLQTRHPDLVQRRVAHTATLREAVSQLPTDTALLEYVVGDSGRMLLFVSTTDSRSKVKSKPARVKVYRLNGSLDTLAKASGALRAECADPRRTDWRTRGRKLFSMLIAPAQKLLAGKQRLLICPDGPLWDVPFAALWTGNRCLAEQFELAYANSATGWMAARAIRRDRHPSAGVLAMANPEFGSSARFGDNPLIAGQRPIDAPSRPIDAPARPIDAPSRPIDAPSRPIDAPSRPIDAPSRPIDAPSRALTLVLRGGKMSQLPGAKAEADMLRRAFPDATVYTGTKAQEATFKQEAGQYRYLHLASHAFFNDASPLLSSVVLAAPSASGKGSEEDGFLTARELFDLKLNAEMVVLSACNTGQGEKRAGEGIIGLTWALSAAGVPTQVISQWSVDDAATATLMRGFYTRLKQGKAKGTALRQAALALKRERKHAHPYYWAPFFLVGDWR